MGRYQDRLRLAAMIDRLIGAAEAIVSVAVLVLAVLFIVYRP